jgi:hypothetical protein
MGASYSSNIDDLAQSTRPGALRLDGPSAGGRVGTVGDRIAGEIAGAIHARGLIGEGTDGAWEANAPSTIKAKGSARPNIDTGQMLATDHIAGEVLATAGDVEIKYGTGEADDSGVSDRDRAYYAETGQSHKHIVRSFFGLIPADCDRAAEVLGDEWDAMASRGGPQGGR